MTNVNVRKLPAYQREIPDALQDFGTNPKRGLSVGQATELLQRHGPNELEAKAGTPWWKRLLAEFTDVLVIMLLVASGISAVLWILERGTPAPYEALAILAIVIVNALLGFVQEAKAESAVAALRKSAAAHATVIRDGQHWDIPAAQVVPGDLLVIEEGDTIPADGRVLQSIALQTAEASLTGESMPVGKEVLTVTETVPLGDRTNMVYSGTVATYGRGMAVVTATGMNTEMGKIADLLAQDPDEVTPLQKELDRVGKVLGLAVVVIAVVMIVTTVLVKEVHGFSALFDVLIMGVALAVAAVPEGLPTITTAVLALGVQRMAKRNAIVRHLAAVEALGSANIIASDKTGTLTKNEMTVRTVVTASGRVNFSGIGYAPEGALETEGNEPLTGALRLELRRVLTVADRANNAVVQEKGGQWTVLGDPTEGAILVAARKAGLEREVLDQRHARIAEVPFSSSRKLMSTIHSDAEVPEQVYVFTKGAPDVLLSHCSKERRGEEIHPLTDERRVEIERQNHALAGEALRVLGAAARRVPLDVFGEEGADEDVEHELVFLGLIGIIDPPRIEAGEAVARVRCAGIRPMMITGDHPDTALVIARELGITDEDRALTGLQLQNMTDQELEHETQRNNVYARVNPEHKLRIINALQRQGAIVAMTGDGVNDAPALKSADIGVAMGITGTDVAKEAADVVLTDDNYATIVAAVEEGRTIFSNIRKFLRYLLSSNIGEVMTMFFGLLLAEVIGLTDGGGAVALPLLATQILWINLITDAAPALALGLDPADPDVMACPPRSKNERVITWQMWRGIAVVGLVMAVGTLGILDASLPGGFIEGTGTLQYGQTMAFTTLTLFQLINVFNARSDVRSAFTGFFRNAWLWAALAVSLVLQLAVVYVPFLQKAFSTVPLSGQDWLLSIAVATSVLWARELTKWFVRTV